MGLGAGQKFRPNDKKPGRYPLAQGIGTKRKVRDKNSGRRTKNRTSARDYNPAKLKDKKKDKCKGGRRGKVKVRLVMTLGHGKSKLVLS